MASPGSSVQHQFANLFSRLTGTQKALLGMVAVGAIAAIVALVFFVNTPNYATLFTNLSPEDASKIVEKLKEKDTPYQLEDGGKSVLVPKQKVYDLRLALAGEGLPQSSVIGYEIFDRTNLGISDFVQKVNYRRALEGELARTILTLEEVEAARVHLVVPEKVLFKEDEKPATASVVLKLRSGKPLRRETVQGIAHLVSSSVEGMDAGNVTIVDSKGQLLSDAHKASSVAALTSTQYELQQRVESYLGQKAQQLLEGVVGAGNALVQVNADLDFRQVERTLEQYDPERTAVRSEQITEEKTETGDSVPPSTRASTVTNYEVNKTVEHIVENLGSIRRLTVAALVNGVPKTVTRGTEQVTEIVPRSDEEMNQLTDLVRKAVGYDALRNDEVSVTNLTFGHDVQEQEFVYKSSPLSDWTEYLDELFLVLAMLGAVVVLRSLLNRLKRGIDIPGMESTLAGLSGQIQQKKPVVELPPVDEEMSPEALLRAERRKQVAQYVREKPTESSRLLKVWLAEE
ncbi:MAG: Flagellar M-ring protein FliF [Bacteroidetes bacterium]|jgi:flagellar M-ring protein FliF|nr:Flagellar M-ring protein FliF [Bacteroidota bacterium]